MRNLSSPVLIAAVAAAFLIACGGGDGGGGGASSEEDAVARAANQHVKVILGIFTGASGGQDLIDAYAPECRKDLKASDVNAALAFIRIFAPQLSDVKIEDVDLGKLDLQKTSEGYEVKPVDVDAARVKVKGKWQSLNEFFAGLGLDEDLSDTSDIETILLVKRDGKWLIGDCADLEDFGGGGLSLGDSTPAAISTFPVPSRATPTPARTGPGSSRTNPVRLGQPARVEDNLWEISVVSVNRDAWPVVQAASRFNDPPAANERMLLITVRARNVSSNQKPENIDVYSFQLVGSRNELYDAFDAERDCGTIPNDLDAGLFPGGQAEGNVCFKVPSDETGFVLVWEEFFSDQLTYFALE